MNSKEFIQNNLKQLATHFKSATFSYVFQTIYNQHIIQVEPKSVYLAEEFAQKQIRFEIDFIDHFPTDDITFIIKDHGPFIEKFDFIIQPKS